MQTRRQFLAAAGRSSLALGFSFFAGGPSGQEIMKRMSDANPKRRLPNILFFLTDDQRNDTLGCAGHPIVKTPVIDGLARQGVRFENMFVTTSICAASRASIFLGVHERTHGYTFGKPAVPQDVAKTSYPLLLRQVGYRTGFTGKYGCQMQIKPQEMFDYCKVVDRNPYFHEMPDGTRRHETDLCADNAIEFLATQPADQPFCLSVWFNASHAEDNDRRPGIGHFPWPPSTDGIYEDIEISKPRLGGPDIYESQPEFLKESLNRQRYFWRWDTWEKYETNMRAYFRMLSGIDNAIGRLMQTLEEKGLADNTVIIYSADNGYYMGDRGFAGKWSHYEQSLRVPLIVYDPRLPEGQHNRVVSPMALNIDIPASILDLAGVAIPDIYQGRSFLPVVRGQAADNGREEFFCEHLMDGKFLPKWEGVRSKRYMYARYFEQEPVYEFLHDLEKDPDQLKNFADDPEYSTVLTRMRRQTDRMKKEYQFTISQLSHSYEASKRRRPGLR